METLDVDIDDDVAEFHRGSLAGLGLVDPVATIIFGRFGDEDSSNLRLAICERAEFNVGASSRGRIYQVPKLGELYVPNRFVANLRGKVLGMNNDLLIVRNRG